MEKQTILEQNRTIPSQLLCTRAADLSVWASLVLCSLTGRKNTENFQGVRQAPIIIHRFDDIKEFKF